jgi:protoheme IX farnesyltransferase
VGRRPLLSLYLDLAKARLSALVVATTAVAYVVVSDQGVELWRLLWTILGTALAAGGANALNGWAEADRDARMLRTRHRPVPSGALSRRHAFVAAVIPAVIGPVLLLLLVNVLTAALAAATVFLYIFVYTPLKPRSPICTLVGAVVGGIPPMMGCTAVLNTLDQRALLLGAILFAWQIPHFLALAWLFRDDYARGGYRMLPVVDPAGRMTFMLSVLYAAILLPLGVMVTLSGMAGWGFAVAATVIGAGFLALSLRLHRSRNDADARRLFLGSLIYLAALLAILVIDRGPVAALRTVEITQPAPARHLLVSSPPSAGPIAEGRHGKAG